MTENESPEMEETPDHEEEQWKEYDKGFNDSYIVETYRPDLDLTFDETIDHDYLNGFVGGREERQKERTQERMGELERGRGPGKRPTHKRQLPSYF